MRFNIGNNVTNEYMGIQADTSVSVSSVSIELSPISSGAQTILTARMGYAKARSWAKMNSPRWCLPSCEVPGLLAGFPSMETASFLPGVFPSSQVILLSCLL